MTFNYDKCPECGYVNKKRPNICPSCGCNLEEHRKKLHQDELLYEKEIIADNFNFQQEQSIYLAQSEIIRELAQKSSCVIVGRCADFILKDLKPYRIFVYADINSRIKRCFDRKESILDCFM